jgi:hypothetical protein
MPDSQSFKIDRSQRIHSDGLVFRVYQVFGTERYGWDHNREEPRPTRRTGSPDISVTRPATAGVC